MLSFFNKSIKNCFTIYLYCREIFLLKISKSIKLFSRACFIAYENTNQSNTFSFKQNANETAVTKEALFPILHTAALLSKLMRTIKISNVDSARRYTNIPVCYYSIFISCLSFCVHTILNLLFIPLFCLIEGILNSVDASTYICD